MDIFVSVWLAFKTVFCTCQYDHKINHFEKVRKQYKISKIGKLPEVINESSGLVWFPGTNSFWTHNDSGTPALFEIDVTGNLLSQKTIPNAQNQDWEDIAKDESGNIYIGNLGNNGNHRKNLCIYKTRFNYNTKAFTTLESITFRYADQTDFPPSTDHLNFDCEAFFSYGNSLFLISKNRSTKHKFAKLYSLPKSGTDAIATPIDSIQINTQVTSADISPDGKTIAVLTYGKILFFAVENEVINFKYPIGCIRFSHMQAEAIAFMGNGSLLATNEQRQIFKIEKR